LSKYVAAVTQCFTLPFIGNSGGNNEPHKIESIDSGLHQIKQPNGRSHRLTLHYTNNTITVGLSPTAFQKEGDKKSFHLNKKKAIPLNKYTRNNVQIGYPQWNKYEYMHNRTRT
jgi:hypothetical protein